MESKKKRKLGFILGQINLKFFQKYLTFQMKLAKYAHYKKKKKKNLQKEVLKYVSFENCHLKLSFL